MAETANNPAPVAATVQAPAIQIDIAEVRKAELTRVQTLLKMGEDYALEQKTVSAAINEGSSVEAFKGIALNEVVARSKTNAAFLDLSGAEAESYSIRKAILAKADNRWEGAGLEREAHEAIAKKLGINARSGKGFFLPQDVRQHSRQMNADGLQRAAAMTGKRDLSVGTAANGGYVVNTDNLTASMVEMLRARSVSLGLGVRLLSGLVGNVTIPKHTGSATVYWVTEGAALTESQQTLGQLAMSPKTMGAYTEYTRLLLNQSAIDIDNFIRMDFAEVAANGIDTAILKGSGAAGQPTGIVTTSSIGGVTGTSLAYAGILEFQTDLAAANALTRECAYVTTPAVAALLMGRQRFTSTDTPLWTGNVLDGDVSGFRATTTTTMTAATMLFGNFSQVILGEWGVEEVDVDPYAAFTAGGVGVRLFKSLDVGVRHAAAFSLATTIT